nr:endosialidase [uncultured Mediterranean phage uvMED]
MSIQQLRSSAAHKRPIATTLSVGQLAVNTNLASPGLFFKDSNGDLVKAGPVHIGANAPNSSPATTSAAALVSGTVYQILTVGTTDFTAVGASGNTVGVIFTATGAASGTGTVSGQQGNEKGELWLDTTSTAQLKVYDGSAWQASSPSSSASSGTGVVLQNAQAIAADLTLTTSYNGLSVGPVTVNAGTTVTVPANATWLVL